MIQTLTFSRVAQAGSCLLLEGTSFLLASVTKDQTKPQRLGWPNGVSATRDPPGLAGDRGCHPPKEDFQPTRRTQEAGLLTPPGKKTSTPQADEIGPAPNVTSPAFLIWHEMSVACVLLSPCSLPSSTPSRFICVCVVCMTVYTFECTYGEISLSSQIVLHPVTLSF